MNLPRATGSVLLLLALSAPPASSAVLQGKDSSQVEPSTQKFDPVAATQAYLAKVPAADRARSDAYREGRSWLMLWGFLFSAATMLVLLNFCVSAKMRDLAERLTRFRPIQTIVYWAEFLLLTSIIGFPLNAYEGFFRERSYGLMNQSFGGWFSDEMKGLMVGLILGGILVTLLVGIVRRLERTWWVWGALAGILFLISALVIAPVFIAPLFNTYRPLQDQKTKERILRMARANGIDVQDVYEVDTSKQSQRVTANVRGLLGTERINLSDNLLRRCTPEQIEAVMGHEMGHYVLNHAFKSVTFGSILIVLTFAWLRYGSERALVRWGGKWGVRSITDVAVIPLMSLLLSTFVIVCTPILNTHQRAHEYEADMFGLNAARQPDAAAEVDLMLGEYRKLDPGPVEEFIFFDHPSCRNRIHSAMRWKAEHLGETQARR